MPGPLIRSTPGLPLDLTEVERFALRNLLAKTIETRRYPLSRRILTLKAILAKLVPALSTKRPAPGLRCPSAQHQRLRFGIGNSFSRDPALNRRGEQEVKSLCKAAGNLSRSLIKVGAVGVEPVGPEVHAAFRID